MSAVIDYIHLIRENFKIYDDIITRIKHHAVVNSTVPKNIREVMIYLNDLLAESVTFLSELSYDDRVHYIRHIKSYTSVHIDYTVSLSKIPIEKEFELKFEPTFQQDKINAYCGGNSGTDAVQ